MSSITLDDVRDFLHTNIRACQRHAEEQSKVLQVLEGNEEKEWLELAQEMLGKGVSFHQLQAATYDQMSQRMEDYVSSVRSLADGLALKELSLQGSGHVPAEQEPQHQDARFVHPELRRFKAEKQAKIVGKYGGAPALGGLVLPNKPRNTILKATGTPAAREIQYSMSEGKDARELADVMRFKAVAKEQERSAWQAEVEAKKGKDFLMREQLQEAAEEAKTKAAAQAASHSPFAKELSDRLSKQRTDVLSQEEQHQLAAASAQHTAKQGKSEMSDELMAKLARMQQQEAQEAQVATSSSANVKPPNSVAWSMPAPFGAELAAALQNRSGLNKPPTQQQGGLTKHQAAGGQISELEACFNQLRKKEGTTGC